MPRGRPSRAMRRLTGRQREFVLLYFAKGCSTQAAGQAMGLEGGAAVRMLRYATVRDAIEEKFRRMGMSAAEVVGRLTAQATCTLDDVLDEAGRFDLDKARKTGAIHQVRDYEIKETSWFDKEGVEHHQTTTKVEMENRQGALGLLARYHHLLTDNIVLRGIPKDERTLKTLLLLELERVEGELPPAAKAMLEEMRPTLPVAIEPDNLRIPNEEWQKEKAAAAAAKAKDVTPPQQLPRLGEESEA